MKLIDYVTVSEISAKWFHLNCSENASVCGNEFQQVENDDM